MSNWNYRVVKSKLDNGEDWYGMHEVYYDDEGNINAISEDAINIEGESLKDLGTILEWMSSAMYKPVLNEDEIEYKDFETEEKEQ